MSNDKVYIYTLESTDETNNVRYVGKAVNPKDREARHMQPYYLKENTYKSNWVKSVLNRGKKIKLRVIDIVPKSEWKYWECYWIEQFKVWGFDLVNGTIGGDGFNLTKETLDKRINTTMTNTEMMLKDFFSKHGVKVFNEIWVGVRNCPACNIEVKCENKDRAQLISRLRRDINENRLCIECDYKNRNGVGNSFYGSSHTEETISLIKSKSKSKTVLQLDLNDNLINKFSSIREAEKDTGIHRRHISGCCNNKPHYNTAGGFKWVFK